MTVIASFVVGSNGATSLGGQSRALSTPADRARFLERHLRAGAYIIGKESALIESYSQSTVPIFIFSRSSKKLELPHPMMQQVTVDRNLREITQLIDLRISGDIVVEAGASLLLALIGAGAVEILEISISPTAGDGNFINLEDLLSRFEIVDEKVIDETRLLECRYNRDSTDS